jgi:repressor of nif and glnA expression
MVIPFDSLTRNYRYSTLPLEVALKAAQLIIPPYSLTNLTPSEILTRETYSSILTSITPGTGPAPANIESRTHPAERERETLLALLGRGFKIDRR